MLTLVTGGSGSGKSAFAEDRVLSFGDAQRIYIATCTLLMKRAIKGSRDTKRCVQEKVSRQLSAIQAQRRETACRMCGASGMYVESGGK